jgi:hypothetical protein
MCDFYSEHIYFATGFRWGAGGAGAARGVNVSGNDLNDSSKLAQKAAAAIDALAKAGAPLPNYVMPRRIRL